MHWMITDLTVMAWLMTTTTPGMALTRSQSIRQTPSTLIPNVAGSHSPKMQACAWLMLTAMEGQTFFWELRKAGKPGLTMARSLRKPASGGCLLKQHLLTLLEATRV